MYIYLHIYISSTIIILYHTYIFYEMGNCLGSQNSLDNLTNNFLNSNIIDKKYKIIIGTYSESNSSKKFNSNTMINQGICIGYDGNHIIYKLKFGIIQRYENNTVELYFENNIKLLFIKNKDGNIKFILSSNDINIEKNMNLQTIKNIKSINDNSEHIDLLSNLI
jgi:hypothetical protein